MKISDTTTQLGAIQLGERYTGLGKDKILLNPDIRKFYVSLLNKALTEIWETVVFVNGRTKFDDRTRLTLPRKEETITADTLSYRMSEEMLIIDRIEYLPTGATQWKRLSNISADEIDVISNYEMREGITDKYNVLEDVIYFYPKLKTGDKIRIYYIRQMLAVEDEDFNHNFGFASPYHDLVPMKASLMWLNIMRPTAPEIAHLTGNIEKMDAGLKNFYVNKNKDEKPARMTYKTYNFK